MDTKSAQEITQVSQADQWDRMSEEGENKLEENVIAETFEAMNLETSAKRMHFRSLARLGKVFEVTKNQSNEVAETRNNTSGKASHAQLE